jgi:outer membrane protein assembly factor BamA
LLATAVALAAAPGVAAAELDRTADDDGDGAATATAAAADDEERSDDGWVALPGVSLTPDAGLGAGAALLRYFRLAGGKRPSFIKLSGQASSTGESEVNLDPELWMAGDRFGISIGTRLAHEEKSYFGIGNYTRDAMREDYASTRFEGRFEALVRMPEDMYLGALYVVRRTEMGIVAPGGELASGEVLGADGGMSSGVGLTLRWDTRDNTFAPRDGCSFSISPRIFRRAFGGDYDYERLLVDASMFGNPWGEHVLALDVRVDLRAGDAPFDDLGMAGGKRYLRGMLEGRFRDRHFVMAQVEYRAPLFWRLGGVVFGGAGRVAGRVVDLEPRVFQRDLQSSAGFGLRYVYDRTERIHVRGDMAFSNVDRGVYLTLGEAF